MAPRLDALVLSLETRAGLAAARSLGRAGYRVGVASWGRNAPGLRTRYAQTQVILPNPNVGDSHVQALVDWLEANPTDVVLTSTDTGLTILHEHRDLISRYAVPAIASPAAVEAALSKEATLRAADELGIPSPRSVPADTPQDAERAIAELGLPAVIKPVHQWRRTGGDDAEGGYAKPRLVESLAEAREAAAEMVSPESPALVQEMVTGGRFEHLQFFRADGRILAQLAIAVDRQWPPFGVSAMRTTVEPPEDTGRWATDLVSALNIEGCASVQFKRDEHGRARLMEVNARLVQTLEVATRAGVDFARMQLEWARGGAVEPVERPRTGLRVGWLGGDLRLAASACHFVEVKPRPPVLPTLGSIVRDYLLRGTRVEGLDLRDPAPAIASLCSTVAALGRAARPRRTVA